VQAVERVVRDPRVELALEALRRLRVRERQRLLDDLVDHAVLVGARRVDPHEERLQRRPLTGRRLGQPPPRPQLGGHRAGDGVSAPDAAELDDVSTHRVPRGETCDRLPRQRGLADPARSDEDDQPPPFADPRRDLGELRVAGDEGPPARA
jgi:hypothetical protein